MVTTATKMDVNGSLTESVTAAMWLLIILLYYWQTFFENLLKKAEKI